MFAYTISEEIVILCLQDTVSVAEITEKESKDMFPQGLPKDFVKQVHFTMVTQLQKSAVID